MILVYERERGGHFTKSGKFMRPGKKKRQRIKEMKDFSKKMYNPKPMGK